MTIENKGFIGFAYVASRMKLPKKNMILVPRPDESYPLIRDGIDVAIANLAGSMGTYGAWVNCVDLIDNLTLDDAYLSITGYPYKVKMRDWPLKRDDGSLILVSRCEIFRYKLALYKFNDDKVLNGKTIAQIKHETFDDEWKFYNCDCVSWWDRFFEESCEPEDELFNKIAKYRRKRKMMKQEALNHEKCKK